MEQRIAQGRILRAAGMVGVAFVLSVLGACGDTALAPDRDVDHRDVVFTQTPAVSVDQVTAAGRTPPSITVTCTANPGGAVVVNGGWSNLRSGSIRGFRLQFFGFKSDGTADYDEVPETSVTKTTLTRTSGSFSFAGTPPQNEAHFDSNGSDVGYSGVEVIVNATKDFTTTRFTCD